MPRIEPVLSYATTEDETAWRWLWQSYLDFYDHPLPVETSCHTWTRLLDPACTMKMRLAFLDGKPVGFAIHQHHPSTWVMGDDCYLEDLFVAPEARGKGVGRALINDLIALSRTHNWHRLYWHTDATNATARKLYDSFVATDGNIRYRMAITPKG